MPVKYRVIAYIDGYNLYHGIRAAQWRDCLWLDLPALARSFARADQELACTKYFTTRISSPESKRKRQSDYLEALGAHCGKSLQMFWGHYQIEPWKCKGCGHSEEVPHEKKTDVNIAVEMMMDAFANRFDTAMLISADSDLVPPIEAVKRLYPQKRIVVVFPPERFSAELQQVAHAKLSLSRTKLIGSQLPECVQKPDGIRLARPLKWSAATPKTAFGEILKSAFDRDADAAAK